MRFGDDLDAALEKTDALGRESLLFDRKERELDALREWEAELASRGEVLPPDLRDWLDAEARTSFYTETRKPGISSGLWTLLAWLAAGTAGAASMWVWLTQ